MKKSTIGVLGVGQVGEAIVEIFRKKFRVFRKDIRYDNLKNKKIEVLHVCIPYSKKFTEIVKNQAKLNKPNLIIIHSTVRPGTTLEIFSKVKIPTVHSPIMGTHENMANYILKFKKFIGPVNKKSALLAQKHFSKIGVRTKILRKPLESEIGKLLDTTYYGWNIVFSKLVWELCKKLNLNFDIVYKDFNNVYNQGYKQSKPNVIRPVLKYIEGPIGGHCVLPNVKILDEYLSTPIAKTILIQDKRFKK